MHGDRFGFVWERMEMPIRVFSCLRFDRPVWTNVPLALFTTALLGLSMALMWGGPSTLNCIFRVNCDSVAQVGTPLHRTPHGALTPTLILHANARRLSPQRSHVQIMYAQPILQNS